MSATNSKKDCASGGDDGVVIHREIAEATKCFTNSSKNGLTPLLDIIYGYATTIFYQRTVAGSKYCCNHDLNSHPLPENMPILRRQHLQQIIHVAKTETGLSQKEFEEEFRQSAEQFSTAHLEDVQWPDIREETVREKTYIAEHCHELLAEAVDQGLLERYISL